MEITPPTHFYDDDIVLEQPSAHGVFIYEQRLAKWVILSGSHKELGRMHKISGFVYMHMQFLSLSSLVYALPSFQHPGLVL